MPEESDDKQPMTLEEAKKTITSGIHFNFGNNIKARRAYHARREEARRIVLEAGYTLEPHGLGYRITNIH